MNRRLVVGGLAALLLTLPATAKPIASRQSSMTRNHVQAVFDKDSGKPTVYGITIPLSFTKADEGKMLELVVESPKPIKIELWTGTIAPGATSWDARRTFLGNSGAEFKRNASFKWMVESGTYTALVLATLPPGEKPEPFLVSHGREVRVATEADKAEWDKAVQEATLNRILALHARRPVAPNFQALTIDGKTIILTQLRNKVVLLYFWSQQDQTTQQLFPLVNHLAETHRAEGLEVIGISMDNDPAAFEQYLQNAQPTWPQVFDQATGNEALADRYDVTGWSGLFLIDGTGRIISKDRDAASLSREVVNALHENRVYQASIAAAREAEAKESPAGED